MVMRASLTAPSHPILCVTCISTTLVFQQVARHCRRTTHHRTVAPFRQQRNPTVIINNFQICPDYYQSHPLLLPAAFRRRRRIEPDLV